LGISRNRGASGAGWEKTDPGYTAKKVNQMAADIKTLTTEQRWDFLMNVPWADLEALVEAGAVTRKDAALIRKANRGR